jgi:hypothetical protein
MTKGWRKLILCSEAIITLLIVALVSKDAVLVGSLSAGLTTILGTVMYGYKKEYEENNLTKGA